MYWNKNSETYLKQNKTKQQTNKTKLLKLLKLNWEI